jgi:hypothetical protein
MGMGVKKELNAVYIAVHLFHILISFKENKSPYFELHIHPIKIKLNPIIKDAISYDKG